MITSINNHVKEKWKGRVELSYFGIDEPGNSKERQNALGPLLKWLKSIPGVTTMETLNGPDMYKLFGDDTDINMGYGSWPDVDKAFMAKGKILNISVWIDSGTRMRGRLTPGLYPWKNKYSATKVWSFKYCSGDPMNDIDSSTPDWCLTAPSQENTDDIIPSVNYECLRKGVDDRRYVVTLERLMVKAKGNAKAGRIVDSAQRLLDGFAAKVPLTTKEMSKFSDKMSFEELEKFKLAVAKKIVEIEQILGE